MRLLVDTQVFLWTLQGNRRLDSTARSALQNADARFCSIASAWEVAIKVGLGKLRFPISFESAVVDNGFDPLTITFAHAAAVQTLQNHHRDPFDRMLIAQALIERLTIITADRAFEAYGVPLILV